MSEPGLGRPLQLRARAHTLAGAAAELPVLTLLAIAVLSVVAAASAAAPLIAPYDPTMQFDLVALKNTAPSIAHPLGTDPFARDLLSRVLYGGRASLVIGLAGAATALVVATLCGVSSALLERGPGDALMGAVDALRAIPRKIILLALLVLVPQPSLLTLALLLGVTGWTAMSRVIYTQVRVLRARDFVMSARALGASPVRIMVRHVFPHLGGTLSAASALLVADFLALEAALSFLGLGVRPPTPSWGTMLQDGVPYLGSAWWIATTPTALLVVTVLCISHLADAALSHAQPSGALHAGQAGGRVA